MNKTIKNGILGLVTVVMILASITSALAWESYGGMASPYTVAGKVDLSTTGGGTVNVKVCNLRTTYCETVLSQPDGDFLIEMGNFKAADSWTKPWEYGDNVEVTYCNLDSCKYKFRIGEVKTDGQRCCQALAVLNLKGPLVNSPVVEPVSEPVKDNAVEVCRADEACRYLIEKDPVTNTEYVYNGYTAKDLQDVRTKYKWGAGFLAALSAVLGGLGYSAIKKARAKKSLKTTLSKSKADLYKRKE